MRSTLSPLHLLFLRETLADDRVHSRLDEGRRYPLASTKAFPIIDQAAFVGSNIDSKVTNCRYELAHIGIVRLEASGVKAHPFDIFARTIDVAMPEVPFDPFEIVEHFGTCLAVMALKPLSKLAHDCNAHGDMKPVEHMLAARTNRLGE